MDSVIKTKRKPTGAAAMGAGPGRPKGCLNKNSSMIRDMIKDALDDLGGVNYLTSLARSHPAAFASLIGKTMPLQVTGENGGAIQTITRVELVAL